MYLVTGATGLLGNNIARELLSRGLRVRVFCRANSDPRPLAGLDVEICEGELNDAQSIRRAVCGCSAVIHSAALIHIGWDKLEHSRAVNVEGTRSVLHACQSAGCRLIHVSTVDVLPTAESISRPLSETCEGVANAPCAYVISKKEAEGIVIEAVGRGLDAVIVNPGFMLGPYDWKPSSGRMMREISRAPIVIAPGGGGSVCDVRDVAHAVVEAIHLGKSGERYILAGRNLSYQDLWAKMLAAMERKRRVYCFPHAVAAFGRIVDVVSAITRRHGNSPNGAEIAMGGLYHYYDSSKAQRELNYRIRPIEETLSDAWKWLK
jgi:dihydroflavonol-4-reductase